MTRYVVFPSDHAGRFLVFDTVRGAPVFSAESLPPEQAREFAARHNRAWCDLKSGGRTT